METNFYILAAIVFLLILFAILGRKREEVSDRPIEGYKVFSDTKHGLGPLYPDAPDTRVDRYGRYMANENPTPGNGMGVHIALENNVELFEQLEYADYQNRYNYKKSYTVAKVTAIPPVVVHANGVARCAGVKNIRRIAHLSQAGVKEYRK